MTTDRPTDNQVRYVRAPRVDVRVETGFVLVQTTSGRLVLSGDALKLLDVFRTPTSINDAIAAVWSPADGLAQWVQVSGTIVSLVKAGVLHDASAAATSITLLDGFGGAAIHASMLQDSARTSSYLEAIAKIVQPTDVVVDLGTGTGILALAAARAGARHVYAIEVSSIGEAAEAMFRTNGMADRITLVRGWSTAITLPERADVLITETIGGDPFDEQITSLIGDAKSRLLVSDARVIPAGLTMFAVPIEYPDDRFQMLAFTPENVARWGESYGFDFRALLRTTEALPRRLRLTPQESRALTCLGPSIPMAAVTFGKTTPAVVDHTEQFVSTVRGLLNAVLIWFDVDLGSGVSLSTAPHIAKDDNSWGNRVVLLDRALQIDAGTTVSLRIDRLLGRLRATCTTI